MSVVGGGLTLGACRNGPIQVSHGEHKAGLSLLYCSPSIQLTAEVNIRLGYLSCTVHPLYN